MTEKRKLRENIDTFPFPSRMYRIRNRNIYNMLGIKNYANVLFKQKVYAKYFSSEFRYDLDVAYREYISYVNEVVFLVTNAILDYLDESYMNNVILPQTDQYKEKLLAVGKKIGLLDNIMSKKLYRINQLVF